MNCVRFPIVKSLFVALLVVASCANASEDAKATKADAKAVVKADPAKGEMLFNTGDAARGITACIACHGAAGNSSIAQNPKLAGQHGAYIHKQLMDFKTPNRNNPVMTGIAKAMTEQDVADIVAYLAKQKPSAGTAKNPASVELGKKIYRGGIAEKSVPACAACHSANGAGIPAQFPRLAGQHQEYIATELTNFRSGARKNSEQMTQITSRMSDAEIQAVSDYVAGLK